MGLFNDAASQNVLRVLKILFTAYAVCSVLYTLGYCFSWGFRESDSDTPEQPDVLPNLSKAHDWGMDKLSWGNYDNMTEQFFLKRVFSEAFQPSQVIPFYLSAEQVPAEEDITITTLITPNRFKVFDRLVTRYKGPISVTIHIPNDPNTYNGFLQGLHELYNNNPLMKMHVDVHLVVDNFERQFNMWRNVAKLFARSNYVMMLDVDFYPCTPFWESIHNSSEIMGMLRQGNTAIVVPAFEFKKQEDGMDYRTFPKTKQELLKIVEEGNIDKFHARWKSGHGSTDYDYWYTTNELYKVKKYQFHYEPYVIYPKDSAWCDERFIGYGANKAACLYELFLSGIDFWVLPDDFIIHQSHAYPEGERRSERSYNIVLYSDYRKEMCLRYARHSVNDMSWNTKRTHNLMNQCHRIKGFEDAVQFFGAG